MPDGGISGVRVPKTIEGFNTDVFDGEYSDWGYIHNYQEIIHSGLQIGRWAPSTKQDTTATTNTEPIDKAIHSIPTGEVYVRSKTTC